MRIVHVTYSLILLILSNQTVIGQDTTFLDTKQQYFSEKGDSIRFDKSHKLKAFPKVNYSREIIKLTEDKYKIENCYYYNNKRFTDKNTTYYNFISDSILITDSEKWIYRKNNDSLILVCQNHTDYVEKGTVSSLIPFVKHGDFVSKKNDNDILFIERFKNGQFLNIESPQVNLLDSIYSSVDTKPRFPEKYGDLNKYILKKLKYPKLATESSIAGIVYVRFVVTFRGQVRNVEIYRGVDSLLDRAAFKVIANLPDFEPGEINGKPVNTYNIMPVSFALK